MPITVTISKEKKIINTRKKIFAKRMKINLELKP